VNEAIRAKEVRLIADDGTQLGIVPIAEALARATDAGLDLVEVAPTAVPPVCRIMDYGKYKYEQKKKAHDSRKHHHTVHTKEIRLRPRTDIHDVLVKAHHAREFFLKGDKVLVTMFFKGREAAHIEIGRAHLSQFVKAVEDVARVEKDVTLEHDRLTILFVPKEQQVKREEPQKPPQSEEGEQQVDKEVE
jgi:translation initiation factor IF-3